MLSASQSFGIVSFPLSSKGKGYQLGDELNVDRSVSFRDTGAQENNRDLINSDGWCNMN